MTEQETKDLTYSVINVAIGVHRELGPGLLEKVYRSCLRIALEEAGYQVRSEVPLPIIFRNHQVEEDGYRLDLLVDDVLIIEIKSVSEIIPVHLKQLTTYLRLPKKPCGLLMNFNAVKLSDGIKRVKNGYLPSE